jgi:ligand-binding sensor domain-containing protein/signal transduction histidine kinase
MGILYLNGRNFVKRVKALFVVGLLMFPLAGFAQLNDPFGSEKIQFDNLDHVKDLENRTVTSIVQDDHGFIWFGTLEGLMRFDGYEIRRFRHDQKKINSLASNSIMELTKDKNGNLWIATQGGGLDKFEIATEKFTHYQHDPTDSLSISDNSLSSILVDSRGMIWAGTYLKGLNMLDPATNKFRRIKERTYFSVLAITEDRSGMIWFSSNGMNRLDPSDFTLKAFTGNGSEPEPISTGGIRSIYQDKNGKFWIATHDDEGVFHFDPQTAKYSRYSLYAPRVSVYTFCEDNLGRIWAGTSHGIAVVDDDRISYYQPHAGGEGSSSTETITSLYLDKEGTIWLGSQGGGVKKIQTTKKFLTFRYSDPANALTHTAIRSLFEDKKRRIWIGWIKGGIDIFDPETNTLTPFNWNEPSDVTCTYQDNDGTFWIGTWGAGLLHYTADGKKIAQYKQQPVDESLSDDRIQCVLRDHNGMLWVGTENGLNVFEDKQNRWTRVKRPYFPYDLLGSNVQSLAMLEAPDGAVWVGTWLGLNRISPDRRTIKHYTLSEQEGTSSGYHVISLCLDQKNSALWIGTFESGLFRLSLRNDEVKQITEEDGLASNTIFGIAQDANANLWLSTSNGLSKYNPDTNQCSNYDAADGLQGNEFFWGVALKTREGKMLFGGVNGLNLFDPAAIVDNTSVPDVVITNFEVFNAPVAIGEKDSLLKTSLPVTKEITLSYDQSVFTFSFAALDYSRPEKNQYAYMLEGFDKAWNYVGNKRTATYTNIDPGEYTFRVKGSNSDGIWNEAGTSITVVITPPFWRTLWFRALSVLIVVGGFLTFYFIRIGIANRQRAVLEHQVRQRTKEITTKNQEILSQMERVKHLSDEIAIQRDNIEKQNNMLAASTVELEKKVKERTIELSHTNNELTRQNLQLEQFAFMTAHNLRAPVARLLGLTAIFNSQDVTDPLNIEILKRIQNSALGLDEVIRDIADILQVQKETHHKLESLLVYPAVARALKRLDTEISEQGIKVVNKIDPGVAIFGITPYVHSVFYNIISNAVKYADLRKKPQIEIESTRNNGHVNITFVDNGIGFDRENLKEKLFKPFSRLNSYGNGKGLGLYLVKIEMESMNGDIDIDSKVDDGTRVTLRFRGDS